MIQAILSYRFVLTPGENDIIEPEFKPVCLVFNNKQYTRDNYSAMVSKLDLFALFYQQTTGIASETGAFSSYHVARLKNTPFQVMSHLRQDAQENQFLTLAVFDLDDEVEIFEEILKKMGAKLEELFVEFISRNFLTIIPKIESEFEFVVFQVNRLSELDKLQKVALIFQSEERIKILELLREGPISKRKLKEILEQIKPNPNIDLLIRPFLELNLIRRDWIKGESKKERKIDIKSQGEYLFLIKDIVLAKFPNTELIERIKEKKPDLYRPYEAKIVEYFSKYDVNEEKSEDLKELSAALLDPDLFDFYTLMSNNFYPLDKLPKIFSDFVDSEFVVNTMDNLGVITKVKDKENKLWVILLTKIDPLISFPEYLLNNLKEQFLAKDEEKKITLEIAKKALELLEVTYAEKVRF